MHAQLARVPVLEPAARGPGAGVAVLLMLWWRSPQEGRGDWGRLRSGTASSTDGQHKFVCLTQRNLNDVCGTGCKSKCGAGRRPEGTEHLNLCVSCYFSLWIILVRPNYNQYIVGKPIIFYGNNT